MLGFGAVFVDCQVRARVNLFPSQSFEEALAAALSHAFAGRLMLGIAWCLVKILIVTGSTRYFAIGVMDKPGGGFRSAIAFSNTAIGNTLPESRRIPSPPLCASRHRESRRGRQTHDAIGCRICQPPTTVHGSGHPFCKLATRLGTTGRFVSLR
jgi:hypothetical protein